MGFCNKEGISHLASIANGELILALVSLCPIKAIKVTWPLLDKNIDHCSSMLFAVFCAFQVDKVIKAWPMG